MSIRMQYEEMNGTMPTMWYKITDRLHIDELMTVAADIWPNCASLVRWQCRLSGIVRHTAQITVIVTGV